ncbi:aspartate aminotransferase AspB [Gottschalkia acidurici 9a]|uniref:Aminotransferase n=1 Tax=Gottschalkia acidurici (strain ATCC 7906 / DSM 604 / BCRC 14475 / CIP 104303 / KCTC 5404 / NCIMB 10678 / 9a) TaxID=1128398 RepID=K0B0U9_GOTA9|nr:pyridoxal phosphate-dependent aminotransferase [Gottschalkia acidurici]AFS78545.1 aspartate aminotransferase AspB [Gottschalkia acidurici 9a]
MKFNLSKKALSISPSLTLEITAKAQEMRNSGIDIIGFGAGEPDFDTPVNIQEAGIKAIKEGKTRYTATSGIPELKTNICDKLKRENDLDYKPSNILVSSGGKHSIFNALYAILNPGDEVIIPVPYWVSYPEFVTICDAVPVLVETKEENGFKYTPEYLEKVITKNTKVIILNSPSNPTGTVYSEAELQEIAKIAIKHNIFIISDEIYEKLVYDNEKHVSIASLNEDIKNLTIVINGMSKAYAMTGWRIGYAAAHEEIIKVMTNLQSHTTSNPTSISQYASVEGLAGDQSIISEMIKHFESRRNYMVDKINSINYLSCIKPKGAFYVMANISQVKGKTIKGRDIKDSLDFTSLLLEEAKVAVVPGIAFGDDNYVRLSYATSMDNIKRGLDRIEEVLK